MSIPVRILERIELFERNKATYLNSRYNEAQVREEFVNLFFEEMGWDVRNLTGKAEAYKDVIHEDSLKISISPWPVHQTRRPCQRQIETTDKQI